jgi:multidrug efflux pump subunit AcrA (membrane-fusion protein)
VRRRWWLPLLILLLASAGAFALIMTKPEPQPVEVAERAWTVGVTKAHPARHAPSVTLYGRIESLWSTELTAAIDAEVREIAVVEGDRVTKDAVLIQLDDRDERLELAQREAELKQTEALIATEHTRHNANLYALPREQTLLGLTQSEVSRLLDLVERKAGAQSALDTARQALEKQAIALAMRQQAVDEHPARLMEVEAARDRAAALRDQARLDLGRATVRASFNGRIAKVLVSPGRRVRIGDPLISLYDTDELLVRAQLPNRYLPIIRRAISEDRPLSIRGEIDGATLQADLRGLAGEASSGTGGVDGLFRIVKGGEGLSQGRFVRVRLSLPARDDLVALPLEALYGNHRIYLVDDNARMRSHRVERVGEARLANGEVRALVSGPGLVAGADVITTQLPNALDGLLVEPVDRP